MGVQIGSISCIVTSLSSPRQYRRSSQISLSGGLFERQQVDAEQLRNGKVMTCQLINGILKVKNWFPKRQYALHASSEDHLPYNELKPDALEQEDHPLSEDMSPVSSSYVHSEGTGGRPGLLTFYSNSYQKEDEILISSPRINQNDLLWFVGPAVLVASFIFPSHYLRRILSAVFEDSLLTDFLILFFTEAFFYSGVAVFLLLVDYLRRPIVPDSAAYNRNMILQLGHRISSVAVLVLSLLIPMVTMGYVWPWTGPAASATLAPYLVGIIVQFAFEQYARYIKSPSWPVIPIIFQALIHRRWFICSWSLLQCLSCSMFLRHLVDVRFDNFSPNNSTTALILSSSAFSFMFCKLNSLLSKYNFMIVSFLSVIAFPVQQSYYLSP